MRIQQQISLLTQIEQVEIILDGPHMFDPHNFFYITCVKQDNFDLILDLFNRINEINRRNGKTYRNYIIYTLLYLINCQERYDRLDKSGLLVFKKFLSKGNGTETTLLCLTRLFSKKFPVQSDFNFFWEPNFFIISKFEEICSNNTLNTLEKV